MVFAAQDISFPNPNSSQHSNTNIYAHADIYTHVDRNPLDYPDTYTYGYRHVHPDFDTVQHPDKNTDTIYYTVVHDHTFSNQHIHQHA